MTRNYYTGAVTIVSTLIALGVGSSLLHDRAVVEAAAVQALRAFESGSALAEASAESLGGRLQ